MNRLFKKIKSKLKTIIYKSVYMKDIEINMHKKETYNEIIQWISFNDKDPLKIKCSDKLRVKKYIEEKLNSSSFTPKTFAIADNIKDLIEMIQNNPNHPDAYIVKANNDSGNVIKIDRKNPTEKDLKNIENYKFRSYGQEKGEWFYSGIEFKCFTEELLGNNMSDYKIHCSNGEPRFCQVISDRAIGKPVEVCVDINGNILDFHLDTNFGFEKKFTKPKNWDLMIETARKLSEDFKLVRVDLYNTDILCENESSIYVGELTFSPRTGRYKGNGQVEAGKLIKGI